MYLNFRRYLKVYLNWIIQESIVNKMVDPSSTSEPIFTCILGWFIFLTLVRQCLWAQTYVHRLLQDIRSGAPMSISPSWDVLKHFKQRLFELTSAQTGHMRSMWSVLHGLIHIIKSKDRVAVDTSVCDVLHVMHNTQHLEFRAIQRAPHIWQQILCFGSVCEYDTNGCFIQQHEEV